MADTRRDGAEAAADYDEELFQATSPTFFAWTPVNYFTLKLRALMAYFKGPAPGAPPGVTTKAIKEDGADMLLHLPEKPSTPNPSPCIVHIHGGGALTGSPESFAGAAGAYARTLGVPVFAFRYRLSQSHPFPAALDDCEADWDYLIANAAKYNVDPARIAIVGDSAGGLFAASLCLRLRDRGKRLPHAVLYNYAMLDDRTAAREDMKRAKHPYWSHASNVYAWETYLRQAPGLASVPKYSVPSREADLRGMPRCWIGVGAADIFADEDVEFARRLREQGVEVELEVVPKAFHLFDAARHPVAKRYNGMKYDYLTRMLGLPAGKGKSKL
ncbi:Alpha/beta hydrolase fold-3 domain protein [Hyaloraphidium curvatum]|nr:Alpha/beta hydrolase fold-3 domain protein [Hyaloraphidium curvatum]